MKKKDSNRLAIENAEIVFRNFSGKEGKFNPQGRRNFCVLLDEDIARELADDGWNIKYLNPRNEDEEPQAYMSVAVTFKDFPPKVWLISSKGKTILTEDEIGVLDWAEIENVDLIINPYRWEVNGKKGVKAYAKTIYVTLVEDEFEKKYYDVPDNFAKSNLDSIPYRPNNEEYDE